MHHNRTLILALLFIFTSCKAELRLIKTSGSDGVEEQPASKVESELAAKLTSDECIDPELSKLQKDETLMLCDGTLAKGTLVIPEPTACNTDGQEDCLTNVAFKAAKMSNFIANDLLAGVSIAGIEGALVVDSTDETSPQVESVKLASSLWTTPFLNVVDPDGGLGYALPTDQDPLVPISWGRLDKIVITFTEPIAGGLYRSNLNITGVNVADYSATISDIALDASGLVYTVTIAEIANDRLRIVIDDAIEDLAGNILDGNNDDTAGGNYSLRFDVLPGELDQDVLEQVTGNDMVLWGPCNGLSIGDPGYSIFADFNGDGTCTVATDLDGAVYFFVSTSLPVGEP